MYQEERENLNNQNLQHQVLVYSYDRTQIFPVDQMFLEMSVEQVCKDIIQAKMGYSSRIHLYKEPVCSFNKIGYCAPTLKMSEIMKQLGVICFTYNNTQYAQELDYHNHPQYSRPPSQDTIETVIQICQNNFFAHENYRLQNTTRIGFFNNACDRFGNNIHVQYFNTRLNITQFANDSIISQTVQKFVDHMSRLSITVDSVPGMDIRVSEVFQQISKDFKIQTKLYFKLCVFENLQKIKYFVISKKCEVKSLRYLLKIYYKNQPSLTYENSKEQIKEKYIQGQKIIIVKFSPEQEKVIGIETPIQNCQIIGSTGNIKNNNLEVIIIKLSSILYRISIDIENNSCYPNMICYLPCINTAHLDEDLFFIRNEQLVSYCITINMIKVKYYTRNGQLLKLKVFPWYKDLYEIQFSVVDMFCVKLKGDNKNKVRVFFIDDPQNYLQIGPCSNFYPAKVGNNVYSDGSGIFAITNHWYQRLQVYSLITKTKLIQFKLQKFKELSQVFFSWQQKERQIDRRKVFLNFSNKQIVIYNMSNGQKIINVLCQKSMSNFFCIGMQLACSIGSQLKIFNIEKDGNGYKFNWGQSIHIPDKCALVLGQNKILVRQKQLKFNIFSKFYIMPTK